jgi:succinoglycan biosynthesis protein ExoL
MSAARSVTARRDATTRKAVALFAPDLTDISTIKRAQAFLDHGFELMVFGFRRARYNRDYTPSWPHVELGRTEDGRYWVRLYALAVAVRRVLAERHFLGRASVNYARNVDQLLLALMAGRLFRSKASIVYEVLDVQPTLLRRGLLGRALRLIERLCLAHVDLLVVSSPAFVLNYYEPVQRYRGKWYLLENKLYPPTLPIATNSQATPTVSRNARSNGYKWVVGYFGLIRGRQTFDLMSRLAERFRHEILFTIRGVFTTIERDAFLAMVQRNRNMVYDGDYVSPRDLERIYRDIDFAWAIDLENVEHNSRWLLPCRFYEAGLFGVPCLAAREFEVGRLIDRLGVGWTFPAPLEVSLEAFFSSVTPAEHAEKRRKLADLPRSTFIADQDMSWLCRLLETDRAMDGTELHALKNSR